MTPGAVTALTIVTSIAVVLLGYWSLYTGADEHLKRQADRMRRKAEGVLHEELERRD